MSKVNFAPKGYRMDWQHAPRVSGLPFGYFDRPLWRRLPWAAAIVAITAAALALAP